MGSQGDYRLRAVSQAVRQDAQGAAAGCLCVSLRVVVLSASHATDATDMSTQLQEQMQPLLDLLCQAVTVDFAQGFAKWTELVRDNFLYFMVWEVKVNYEADKFQYELMNDDHCEQVRHSTQVPLSLAPPYSRSTCRLCDADPGVG